MADETTFDGIKPGVYNVEYFSSSQVALFIGDVLVDEVTSLNFTVQQNRRPLYGYADQFFRQVSKGQIIVQGQFSINFKEAGYLWLILARYKKLIKGLEGPLDDNPWTSSGNQVSRNIERMINAEIEPDERTKNIEALADSYASLTGFSSRTRARAALSENSVGRAEGLFENFEDKVWGPSEEQLLNENRRADDVDLNPFDIFISYGDFAGDNRANHTIIKLEDVYIVGTAQRIEIDGNPVQESYSFFAKTRV